MVKLADTPALGAGTRKGVEVRVLFPAPSILFRESLTEFIPPTAGTGGTTYTGHTPPLAGRSQELEGSNPSSSTRQRLYSGLLILLSFGFVTCVYR